MKRSFLISSLSAAVVCALSYPVVAADSAEQAIEHVTILGSQQAANATPGSASYISEQQLEVFSHTDISKVLSTTPGVYVQEEDGYGLRPNIGMRGTGTGRNEKITVMEDGVLVAPAPYVAPSAYYFPTTGRMQAIEIIKGSSSVKYGPRSTGGVLNLVSRAIPEQDLAGRIDVALGSDGFNKAHGVIGGTRGTTGAVLEAFHYGADGFKSLPNGGDTGFDKNDLLFKAATRFGQNDAHGLAVKLKYADETSDETYAGLTDADYRANPYRRYAASQQDQMNTRHNSYQLNYDFDLGDGAEFTAMAYLNDFHRNWYKASKVKSADLQRYSDFEADTSADNPNVTVRANNRNYLSKGLQSELSMPLADHLLSFGARLHQDEEDRFQWDDVYLLNDDLTMTLTEAGTPGTQDNRLSSADALALFVHDEWTIDNLVLSFGVRYEDVDTKSENWNKATDRSAAPSVKKGSSSALLPSVGMTYRISDSLVVLAGVQKGFAPAAAGNAQQQEEESLNTEVGLRFNQGTDAAEVVLFQSKYDNMHGNCTASVGCNVDNIGDQYNFGEVLVTGVELSTHHEYQYAAFRVPVSLSYTYTDSEFETDFNSGIFGPVSQGDHMPYVPKHQFSLQTGLFADNYSLAARASYVSDAHASLNEDGLDAIDSRTIVDLSAKYNVAPQHLVYLNIDNVLDKTYVANRANGGIQPGKPRSITLGYRYDF